MSSSLRQPYSAHVEAWLTVNGKRIAVGSVGPTFFYAREGQELPEGCTGNLELIVDHTPIVWRVKLPRGAVPFDLRIEFEIDVPDTNRDGGCGPLQLPNFEPKTQRDLF